MSVILWCVYLTKSLLAAGRDFLPALAFRCYRLCASETGAPQTNISHVRLGKYSKSNRNERAQNR